MRYEWDDTKAAVNIRKHGVRFSDAVRVFDDPAALVQDRTEDDYGEERWAVIGRPRLGRILILTVIFTERHPATVRLISARPATGEEIDDYYARLDPL